jgi:hypothetical protein
MVGLVNVAARPPRVVLAQGFTDPREHVHDTVIVLGVVAGGREDQALIAVKKQVPAGLGPGSLELGHPGFHPRDLRGDAAGYSTRDGHVKS